ncbi:hypothetical protein GCM10010293_32200 [Streptomyces griseoflavus]|nr:hypothetical protein GCM10010293_32200 [Streptomyces griseoflavus]
MFSGEESSARPPNSPRRLRNGMTLSRKNPEPILLTLRRQAPNLERAGSFRLLRAGPTCGFDRKRSEAGHGDERGKSAVTGPAEGRDDTVRPDIDMPEEKFLLEFQTLPEILGSIFSGGPPDAVHEGTGHHSRTVG